MHALAPVGVDVAVCTHTCGAPGSLRPLASSDASVPLPEVQMAARHADPRTTYDDPREFHQRRDGLIVSVSE